MFNFDYFPTLEPQTSKTEFHTQSKSEQPYPAQLSYPGEGVRQTNTGGSRVNSEAAKWRKAPASSQPRSPQKPVDRDLLNVPLRDDERPSKLGTPLVTEEF